MSGSREASVQWKPEWIDALRGLALSMSATMIAAEVNGDFGTAFTRSAVIGKAKREGIPLRAGKGGRTGPHGGPSQRKPRVRASTKKLRPAASPHPGPKLPTAPMQLRCDPLKAGTFHVTELEPGMCRYPSGDHDFRFCGLNQEDGMPYCGPHCRIAYREDRRAA